MFVIEIAEQGNETRHFVLRWGVGPNRFLDRAGDAAHGFRIDGRKHLAHQKKIAEGSDGLRRVSGGRKPFADFVPSVHRATQNVEDPLIVKALEQVETGEKGCCVLFGGAAKAVEKFRLVRVRNDVEVDGLSHDISLSRHKKKRLQNSETSQLLFCNADPLLMMRISRARRRMPARPSSCVYAVRRFGVKHRWPDEDLLSPTKLREMIWPALRAASWGAVESGLLGARGLE